MNRRRESICLSGDFLGVSRPQVDEVSNWQVADAVASTLRLLKYKHKQDVSIETCFGHVAPIFGKTGQLNQVLMNLLDNAMRAAGPGKSLVVHGAGRRHVPASRF